MERSKMISLWICGIVAVTCLFVVGNSFSNDIIEDAAVNAENGNIAFAYVDKNYIVVQQKDTAGNAIASHTIYSEGGSTVYLQYVESELLVYVSRVNTLFTYSDEGVCLTQQVVSASDDQVKQLSRKTWKNWKRQDGALVCEFDDIRYVYRASKWYQNFLEKSGCVLQIQSEDGEIVIYSAGEIP